MRDKSLLEFVPEGQNIFDYLKQYKVMTFVIKKRIDMTMSITKGRIISIRSSFLSECKNVQKSALKNVNVQTSAKSIFQFFAFSFFEGSHICRFLPILRPSSVPRSHFRHPQRKASALCINDLYLQIVTSASANKAS